MIQSLFSQMNEYIIYFTTWLNNITGNNQFLAGVMMVTISGLAVTARKIPGQIYRKIVSSFTIVQIYSSTGIIANVQNSENIMNIAKWFTGTFWFRFVRVLQSHRMGWGDSRVSYLPSRGTYFCTYKGRPLLVVFSYWTKEGATGDSPSRVLDISVKSFGISHKFLEKFIEEITPEKDIYEPSKIYKLSGSRLTVINHNSRKCLDNTFMNGDTKEEIRRIVTEFIVKRNWYIENGFTYKESLMLYGPPGTGKSTLARTISNHFDLDMYVTSLEGISEACRIMNEFSYDGRRRSIKIDGVDYVPPSIILIEDVDTEINMDRGGDKDKDSPEDKLKEQLNSAYGDYDLFKLGQVLNSLDGINSPEDVIFIFTSNYIEKLDDALVREGRMNHKILIGYLGKAEVNEFIKKRFKSDYEWDKEIEISLAKLQNFFLIHSESEENFIKALETFIKEGGEDVKIS